MRPAELAEVLPTEGNVWVQSCSAESGLLRDGVLSLTDRPHRLCFSGIFVPGLNRADYLLAGRSEVETFFATPELRPGDEKVSFLPLSYRDIWRRLNARSFVAALFMVSPPDEDGICSFGPVADFLPELWSRIPIRVAHVNPLMPRTTGYTGIPFSELTAVVEGEQVLVSSTPGDDPTSLAVAGHVASLVPDGATIQAGLGRVPELAVAALKGHRKLRVHSGLIGDSTIELIDSGALDEEVQIDVGVAIGTRRLYDAIASPRFSFSSVGHTHSARVLSRISSLVTINSALEVDLFGQAYSELGPGGLMSGPGGASDFAAGAREGSDLRIIALASSASSGRISRIVAPGVRLAPVSLGRFDIDVVVTEHGAADLRGLTHTGRAEALIAVAAPDHRPALSAAWDGFARSINLR